MSKERSLWAKFFEARNFVTMVMVNVKNKELSDEEFGNLIRNLPSHLAYSEDEKLLSDIKLRLAEKRLVSAYEFLSVLMDKSESLDKDLRKFIADNSFLVDHDGKAIFQEPENLKIGMVLWWVLDEKQKNYKPPIKIKNLPGGAVSFITLDNFARHCVSIDEMLNNKGIQYCSEEELKIFVDKTKQELAQKVVLAKTAFQESTNAYKYFCSQSKKS